MDNQQNRTIHALLAQLGLMGEKASIVAQVTEGRTDSAKGMDKWESNRMIAILQQEKEGRVKKTRGKIIHLLCLLGYVKEDGSPDYSRINKYVQGIGSRNPKKRKLYWLSVTEMVAVCSQVEAMYLNETKRQTNEV